MRAVRAETTAEELPMSHTSVLAAGSDIGYLFGYLAIPVLGLVLLIVGLVTRGQSAARPPQQPPPPYGWAPGPQQYGAPPPPPPGYGPPPGYPPPGHPPPPPPAKKRGSGLIIAGAVILALSVLGGIGRIASTSDSATSRSNSSPSASSTDSGSGSRSGAEDDALAVGDCVADVPDYRDPDVVDCSDPTAQLELGAIDAAGQCPDGPASQGAYIYQEAGGRTRCFLPMFDAGECFRVDSVETMFNTVDCSDPDAAGKVSERIDTNDPEACAPPAKALAFPEPARTYCLMQQTHA